MENEQEEKRGEIAFKLHSELVENEKMRRVLLIRNALIFEEILKEGYQKEILGDENATWSSYLASPDVWYTRHMVQMLIRVSHKFGDVLKLNLVDILDIPITKLDTLVQYVTPENVEEYLASARNYGPRDWRIFKRQLEGLSVEEECSHDFANYEICKICGEKHRVL